MVADDQRQHNSNQERFTARVVMPWTNNCGEKNGNQTLLKCIIMFKHLL